MEHLGDLDELADRLQPMVREWQRWAVVRPLTWRDERAPWPQSITSDRASVQVPESLGLSIRKHLSDDEFEAVVWTGGWADVDFVLGGNAYSFCPEFRSVDEAYSALTKDVEDFLA